MQPLGLKAVGVFKIPFWPSSPEFIASRVQYRSGKLSFESKRKKAISSRRRNP
jgi:hypothetical protein